MNKSCIILWLHGKTVRYFWIAQRNCDLFEGYTINQGLLVVYMGTKQPFLGKHGENDTFGHSNTCTIEEQIRYLMVCLSGLNHERIHLWHEFYIHVAFMFPQVWNTKLVQNDVEHMLRVGCLKKMLGLSPPRFPHIKPGEFGSPGEKETGRGAVHVSPHALRL